MQCGVACLASICEYYGKKYSTQFISKLCSCTPTGISLQSLKLAAEQLGFDSKCVRIPKDSILECNLPCILHWNQNHFVVLYKIVICRKVLKKNLLYSLEVLYLTNTIIGIVFSI